MYEARVAVRYAKALLQHATQTGQLEKVYKDLYQLNRTGQEVPGLHVALKVPSIGHREMLHLLQLSLGPEAHSLTVAFFKLLIYKKREGLIPIIAQKFIEEYHLSQKVKTAYLTTAIEISDPIKERFKTFVIHHTQCTGVALVERVDPSLIGGYILKIDDIQIDASLRSKLKKIKQQIVQD